MLKTAAFWLLLILVSVPRLADARAAPYPIIFLHGLFETAERWFLAQPKLTELNLEYGGTVWVEKDENDRYDKSDGYDPSADYFFVSFGDNQGEVLRQVRELEIILDNIIKDTKAEKVQLVGFSMGGLVARTYLTRHLKDHRVSKMVSIGSPHQGSNWSKLYGVIKPIKDQCAKKNLLSYIYDWSMCPLAAKIEGMGGGMNLASKAVSDMTPPIWEFVVSPKEMKLWSNLGVPESVRKCIKEENGEKIYNIDKFYSDMVDDCKIPVPEQKVIFDTLAFKPMNLMAISGIAEHPADVAYVSTVGEVNSPEGADDFMNSTTGIYEEQGATGALVDKIKLLVFLKKGVGLMSSNPTWGEGGDGAVTVSSQNLSKLPWFAKRVSSKKEIRKKPTNVIKFVVKGLNHPLHVEKIQTDHMSQVVQFDDIYKGLLEKVN